MKKYIAFIIALTLCLSLCSCGSQKIEGSGYDSPESALSAYMFALQSGDMAQILSTFAIETFLDNYDLEEYLEYCDAYARGSTPYLPEKDDYTHKINLMARQNEIVQDLTNMYYTVSLENYDGNAITPEATEDPEDFRDSLMDEYWLDKIEPILIDTNKYYIDSMNPSDDEARRLDEKCEYYGCDEIALMVGHVYQGGVSYYFYMDVARYGNKWYNLKADGVANEGDYSNGTPGAVYVF